MNHDFTDQIGEYRDVSELETIVLRLISECTDRSEKLKLRQLLRLIQYEAGVGYELGLCVAGEIDRSTLLENCDELFMALRLCWRREEPLLVDGRANPYFQRKSEPFSGVAGSK